MKSKAAWACAVGLALAGMLKSARAEEVDFAVVVMVSDTEVVFDKGTKAGAKTGAKARIYRCITVHHPVTGKEITDKFPIGDVKVEAASELLSIIKNSKKLEHPPKVGDLVELLELEEKKPAKPIAGAAQQEPPGGEPQPAAPQAPVKAEDPDRLELDAILEGNLGEPLSKRIYSYAQFLGKYPKSAYAARVAEEIAWLKKLNVESDKPSAGEKKTEKISILHSKVGPLEVGDQAQVVVAVLPPDAASKVHMYIRAKEKEGFDQVALKRESRFYFRAHIPEKFIVNSGDLLYFIEVVTKNGQIINGAATEEHPIPVKVTRPVVDNIERSGRTTASAKFDYVNFDMDNSVDDEYFSFEADVFYRIRTFLYGVRVGTGVFNGTGGNIKDIEENADNNEKLSALYGYVEGEFEVVPLFHFMLRGLAGTQRDPGDDTDGSSGVFGMEGGVRVGLETETNLVVSGAIFQDIGYEGRIELAINRFRKIPIVVEGLVTNFPVEESRLGLRLVVGAGYRFTDWFAIIARGSWNARTITHTGFGGGASVALSW